MREYSEFTNATAARMLAELPPDERRRLVKEKTAELRREGRWEKLGPEARDTEVDRLIVLDLAKVIATYDDWLEQRTKGASIQ